MDDKKRYQRRPSDEETVVLDTRQMVRMSARPSAESLIKSRAGDKCVHFGDIVPAGEFTATFKVGQMDESLKAICGDKKYVITRIKEISDKEIAVRIRLGSLTEETLIS